MESTNSPLSRRGIVNDECRRRRRRRTPPPEPSPPEYHPPSSPRDGGHYHGGDDVDVGDDDDIGDIGNDDDVLRARPREESRRLPPDYCAGHDDDDDDDDEGSGGYGGAMEDRDGNDDDQCHDYDDVGHYSHHRSNMGHCDEDEVDDDDADVRRWEYRSYHRDGEGGEGTSSSVEGRSVWSLRDDDPPDDDDDAAADDDDDDDLVGDGGSHDSRSEEEEREQRTFRDNDDHHREDEGGPSSYYDRGGRTTFLDGIVVDHLDRSIRRPQSMRFEEDNRDYHADHHRHDYDDAGDEVEEEHPSDDDAEHRRAPMEEVSFVVRDHRGEGCGERRSRIDDDADDDRSHRDEVFSSLDSDCDADGRRGTAQSFPETNFRSSGLLDVVRRIESVMMGLVGSLDGFESVLRGYRANAGKESSDVGAAGNEHSAFARRHAANGRVAADDGGDPKFHRNFDNIAQSRSFASICCVMSFVHQLLMSNRTTTTREVYYVFVTHFRNQRECDDVILDVARLLGVSRRSMGLSASPKGWFCGCVEISSRGTLPSGKDVSGIVDGTSLLSVQGLPITREWTERDERGRTEDGVEIRLTSKRARVILVIEKEGVYNRLSEERIYDRMPCILVTGKGFPDLATRALVSALHRELDLPVVGLCDCNPYGVSVLSMYHCAGDRMGVDGRRRYTVPIRWLGLRPSEVDGLRGELPETVFQRLTDLDRKRIASLLDSENPFLTDEDEEEVRIMGDSGYKVELEALYWLGPDHMGNWVVEMLKDECDHECEQQT